VKPWKNATLGDHVSFVRTVALSRAQLDTESPTRYLHYGDIHTSSRVTLDAANEPMPRADARLLRNAAMLEVGDLVMADASEDRDGVGKSIEITSVPAAGIVAGLHTIAARFDSDILTDGFKAYLQFIPTFRETLLQLAAGTKVLATTRGHVSSISLKLPPLDEQRAIAEVLRDSGSEIEALRQRLLKSQNIKHGMTRELLTGRIRLPAEGAAA
jgi:type I restriction enzyme S subunit